jgi:RNA polymerase sigma-70 factor (ECF subfamily)
VADATDRARFAAVFLPHLTDAYRLARWLTGSRADAEDVVQEASLRAFKGIGRFSGTSSRAWVLTIVRNAAYSWLAKNRPAAIVLTGDLGEAEQERVAATAAENGGARTPEEILIAKRDAEEVRRQVAALPLAFREVLVLREIHELEYREIAAVAEIPIGTVMSRLARARRLLAASIGSRA